MLERVHLQNFRGFADHEIPLREFTIIVGANNAGKSTLVEALRLLALVVGRISRGTSFTGIPEWLDHPDAHRGVSPALRGRGFEGHGSSTFHRYGDPPALITGHFTDGASVTVFVGPEGELHGVARGRDGRAAGTAADAAHLELSALAILPQVAPLLRREPIRAEETVRRGEGTYLAPLHFRNQLYRFDWGSFKELAEASWPGLQIRDLRADPIHPNEPIELDIRDGAFVGEVSLMGHGLQMWLQTIWFLARTQREAIVVLDEPDVYMHPDIQRRLLSLVRHRYEQILIATHSIEIIADVDPRSILSIEKDQARSSFLTDLPGVQNVIDAIGGVHSIQVTRLFRSRAMLLVEGDDIKLLRILQLCLSPTAEPIDLVPRAELGGRGGWLTGLPSRLPTKNAAGEAIRSYCVLDRDYFPEDEIQERLAEARRWKVNLWVWQRKELENYLLVPSAIVRLIAADVGVDVQPPDSATVEAKIDEIIDGLRDSPITDGIANEIFIRNRRAGMTPANTQARSYVSTRWATRAGRWAIAPGKDVLSALASWSQTSFGVTFGPEQVARHITQTEIDPEVGDVIGAIMRGGKLPQRKNPP